MARTPGAVAIAALLVRLRLRVRPLGRPAGDDAGALAAGAQAVLHLPHGLRPQGATGAVRTLGVDRRRQHAHMGSTTYSCRYSYATGFFTLSVKELSGRAQTYSYSDTLGSRLGDTGKASGLGQAALSTASGSLVVRKDWKVLLVDVNGLPAQFGVPDQLGERGLHDRRRDHGCSCAPARPGPPPALYRSDGDPSGLLAGRRGSSGCRRAPSHPGPGRSRVDDRERARGRGPRRRPRCRSLWIGGLALLGSLVVPGLPAGERPDGLVSVALVVHLIGVAAPSRRLAVGTWLVRRRGRPFAPVGRRPFYQASDVDLPVAGSWNLTVTVRTSVADRRVVETVLPVH